MSDREKQESVFKVVDKRRFTAEGDVRADAPPDTKRDIPRPTPAPALRQEAKPKSDPRQKSQLGRAPQQSKSSVDFMSFVASLATNAMAGMGLLPEAQARGMPVNHALAREYIDIIVMLQERTQGNLSSQEDQALTRLLQELRMQFLEVTQGGDRPAGPGGPGPAPRPRR